MFFLFVLVSFKIEIDSILTIYVHTLKLNFSDTFLKPKIITVSVFMVKNCFIFFSWRSICSNFYSLLFEWHVVFIKSFSVKVTLVIRKCDRLFLG